MANEAVCIVKPTSIATRICADAVAIPKGTLCKLSGTNIAIANPVDMSGAAFAGITIEEKTASDGVTTIGCALDGVWDIRSGTDAAALTTGGLVSMSGSNMVHTATADNLLIGAIIGKIEEIKSAAADTIRVRLLGV